VDSNQTKTTLMRDTTIFTNTHETLHPQTAHGNSTASVCTDAADVQEITHHLDLNLEEADEHPWSAGYEAFAESVGASYEERGRQEKSSPRLTRLRDAHQESVSHTVGQVFVSCAVRNPLQPWANAPGGEGRGTCFAVDTSSYPGVGAPVSLLTNYHVVKNQVRLEVSFPAYGERKFEAEIVGCAPQKDMALLRISAPDCVLRPVRWGNSDEMGDAVQVVAEGYPRGMIGSCKTTQGTLSGIQTLRTAYGGTELIQHTADLNPGNSGGPLTVQTPEGKTVIGMNSMIIKGGRGMNYALPINAVRKFVEKVSYKGTPHFMRSPYLGLFCQPSTASQTELLNNPRGGGYYVNHVVKGSVAYNGGNGLRKGDQIIAVNENPVSMTGSTRVPWATTPIGMNQYLSRQYLGDEVTFKLYRNGDGQQHEVAVRFEDQNPFQVRSVFTPFEQYDYEVVGGMVVSQMTQNHVGILMKANMFMSKYLFPDNLIKPHLVVSHIFPGSVAERQHAFSVGTVLDSVNGATVRTIADLRRVFEGATEQYFQFTSELDSDLVLTHSEITKSDGFCSSIYNCPPNAMVANMGPPTTTNHLSFERDPTSPDFNAPYAAVGASEAASVQRFVVSSDESHDGVIKDSPPRLAELEEVVDALRADLLVANQRAESVADLEADLAQAREHLAVANTPEDRCCDHEALVQTAVQEREALAHELACAKTTHACELDALQGALRAANEHVADQRTEYERVVDERSAADAEMRRLQEELHVPSLLPADVAVSDDEASPISFNYADFLADSPAPTATHSEAFQGIRVEASHPSATVDGLTDPLGLMAM